MKYAVIALFMLYVFGCAPTQGDSNRGVQQLGKSCTNNKLSDRFYCAVENGKNIKHIFQSNCDFHQFTNDTNNTSDPAIYLKGKWSLNQNFLSYTLNGQENEFTIIWSTDDQSFTSIENQLVFNRCN